MNMPKDGRRQSYRIDLDIFYGNFNNALHSFEEEVTLAKKMLCYNFSCKESELTVSIEKDYNTFDDNNTEPTWYILITGIVDSGRRK